MKALRHVVLCDWRNGVFIFWHLPEMTKEGKSIFVLVNFIVNIKK